MKRLGHTPPGSPATALTTEVLWWKTPCMVFDNCFEPFSLPKGRLDQYRWVRAYINTVVDLHLLYYRDSPFDLAPRYRPLTITEHSV